MDIWTLSSVSKLPDRSVEDRFAFDANHRESRCPILALGKARQKRPRSATSRSADGSRPWPVLPPAHDHGHGMNEQREAVADRPIESDQQRKRHDQFSNT